MKTEDTKRRILEKALELFAARGYTAVSVAEIAQAVGIKAPSLYNHYPSKQAIFEAIVAETAAQYEEYTNTLSVHVERAEKDNGLFSGITLESLQQKVRQIFVFSLHNPTVSRFRRMMTIEQYRLPELSALYSERYVDRLTAYHAAIFRKLAEQGEICAENPQTLALLYVSPILTLLGVCDRQPEREDECVERLDAHVRLFYQTFHTS